MCRLVCSIILFNVLIAFAKAQGLGTGYFFDVGGSRFNNPSDQYHQTLYSYSHYGFIRVHNKPGNNAIQFLLGYRTDKLFFENHSQYLLSDKKTVGEYDNHGYLRRNALKYGIMDQIQFGQTPGKFVFSLNAGMYIEQTVNAMRIGIDNDWSYKLRQELNRHNFGLVAGAEIRFWSLEVGIRFDKLINDILDRNYIHSQGVSPSNCSELRGIISNPLMVLFQLGINIDVFHPE